MTDQAAETKAADSGEQRPRINTQVLGHYIRDLSFENITVRNDVDESPEANINVQVNLHANKRPVDRQYEVIIGLNIEARSKENQTLIYVLEIEYAGIVLIENLQGNQLHPYLLIQCPRILFPYLRRIVSDVTRDSGFSALNLGNIDFVKLYRDEMTRLANEKDNSRGVSET